MEGTVEYANFRAWVPRNVLPVGTLSPQDWVFYDWGPRGFDEPLLCLHPILGSAESFYLQTLALASRGYRVLSPQLPVYLSAAELCDALHTFLDMLGVRRVHIYGAGLGGFLALQFACRRPERVLSVALTHSFLSTNSVDHGIVYTPAILRWLPDYLVRRAIRGLCPSGPAPLHIAEAAEFVIRKTLESSREELSSRLALLVSEASVVGRLQLDEDRITFIDAAEYAIASATGIATAEEARNILPNARRALLKSCGDFPYLSSPDEVAMHLIVHLRRNAAPPLDPLPLPPPARARRVPSRRRRGRTSPVSSDNDSTAESAPDVVTRAEDAVSASEATLMKQYSTEVAKVRPFLPDRDDNFILSVLIDCDGDADAAVAKTRDGKYSKRFYEKARRRALRVAEQDIRAADREAANLGVPEGPSTAGNETSATLHGASSENAVPTNIAESTIVFNTHSDLQSVRPSERDALIDPPRLRNDRLGNPSSSGALTLNSISRNGTPENSAPALCEVLGSPHLSTGVIDEDGNDVARSAAEQEQSKKRRSHTKSARWKSLDRYSNETDSVTAYVTSERVGMRNDALISRGPTPLPSTFPSYPVARVNAPRAAQFDESTEASAHPSAATQTGSLHAIAAPQASMQPEAPYSPSSDPKLSRQESCQESSTSDGTAPVRAPLPPPTVDDDDGWGAFRRMGLPPVGDDKVLGSIKAAVDGVGSDAAIRVDDGVDEASRLRDWVMSARTASESAQRRGL